MVVRQLIARSKLLKAPLLRSAAGSRESILRLLTAAPDASPIANPRHTAVRPFSTRRRRRGGAPTETRSASLRPNRPIEIVNDTLEFCLAAQDFLDKIEDSLEGMKRKNRVFSIEREANKLTLTILEGDYSLEIVEETFSIALQTCISGKFNYVLNAKTRQWESEYDGHLLEGMFVRDLIRQCNGVPNL